MTLHQSLKQAVRNLAPALIPVMLIIILTAVSGKSSDKHESLIILNRKNTAAPAVGFSAEPKLVIEGSVQLPLKRLLKKGVSGILVLYVDIDQEGKVEQCSVRSGVDPLLDSLIRISILRSRFTPAYEEGRAVASSIVMSYEFNGDAIVRNSTDALPDIRGTVLEEQTLLPVKNARINCEIADSLADSELHIPMSAYLRTIGLVPGQSENNGILSTTTDSLGCFTFRLLPSCPVRMAIIAPRYEIAHVMFDIRDKTSRKVTCYLEYTHTDTAMEIVVYGSPLHAQRLDIEEEQLATGLTHFLSGVLQTQAAIRSIPESRSTMMVRAGSPFDNRYYICGVPFLAPYHFGGHPFADVDGLMISTLSEIDLTVDRIAGRQIDASGFRIDAQPGIYRPANRTLLKRPEASIDINTMGQDILVSLPQRRSDNCLQLGITRSENYTLRFLNSRRGTDENKEYGNPTSYGNVPLTGSAALSSVRLNSFSWLAWDTYRWYTLTGSGFEQSGQKRIPWGMASVTATPADRRFPTVSAGGSRQYFADGKRYGASLYNKFTAMSDGVLSLAYDSLKNPFIDLSLEAAADYMQWDGSVERTFQTFVDSLERKTPAGFNNGYYNLWKDTASAVINEVSGREFTLQMHGAVSKAFGSFAAAVDLLGAVFLYGKVTDAAGDAGVSLIWHGKAVQAGLHGGRITSRPDIRGLPDSLYRRTRSSCYLFSFPVFFRTGPGTKFGIQPYIRRKISEPKLDPILRTWIPDAATPLVAAGADFDAEVQLFRWLAFNGAANLSHTRRRASGGGSFYEWDVPWGGRGTLHLQFGKENQVHLYCNGYLYDGFPVADTDGSAASRLPQYRRMDLNVQYRSRIINHRHLTRYDAYFNFFNLTGRFNAADYYWDETAQWHMIPLGDMFCELGVRLGFRL